MKKLLTFMLLILTACFATHVSAKKNGKVDTVWNNVAFGGMLNMFNDHIKVTKVELGSEGTQVTMYISEPRKGDWIRISPKTVLKTGDKEYALKSSTVLTIGEKYIMPEDTVSFTLTFEPLPQDTKAFDLIEPKGWVLTNIHNRLSEYIADTYWRNKVTGDWFIGFTKDYVIHDCKVKKIVNQTEKKGAYAITTDDGTTINAGKMKNGIRSIKVGNGSPVQCDIITGNTLPDYPVKDLRKGFKDNGYSLTDSVTICGWIRDIPKELKKKYPDFNVTTSNVISTRSNEYKIKFDSLGMFRITIPLMNTSGAGLWHAVYTVLEPGETYFLLYDFTNGNKLFMGTDVRLQNELLTHESSKARVRFDYGEENIDAMKFWQESDSVRSVQKAHLQNTLAEHPNLSQRYADYTDGYYLVDQGEYMMLARFNVPERKLPKEYTDYVGNEIWQKMPKPYTLYTNFGTFSRDYIDHLSDFNAKRIKIGDKVAIYKQEDNDKEIIDSVCQDRDLHDIVLAQRLYYELDWKRKSLPSDMQETAEKDIALPAMRDYVLNLNSKYAELEKLDISSSPCLKSADAIEGMTDGEEIFRKLTEPYKGKVILIDVWGTWCSPCKKALEHSQEEYERLKPYDVVYMYFAMSSEDTSWKNVIKQYNVLGDNVVHYNLPREQEMALERYIKVHSYPTYKLVDKQGNLLEDKVDARNLDALEKLLKKL